MNAKKALRVLALTLALVFMFSAVAAAATPSIIYYKNAAGKVVQADYQAALDQAVAGNTALLDALKKAFVDAQDNFRDIMVKNDDGSVVDWKKALTDKKSYQEAMADSNYAGTEPAHELELVLDESGSVVERPAWPVEMEGLPLISYSDLTQKTYATITIKAEYVDKVTAVTIAGKAAVQQPDRSKWRAEVPAGTTAESLAGKIVITVQQPPAPGQWPAEMEGLPLISYSDLTQKTYATITIKAEYVDKVTAVTIAGKAAVQQPDRSKWRAEVPAGTTAESLAGKIVITVQQLPAPGPVEAIKEIRAKLDLFGQTRVWVFLNEGIEAASVTANGQALQYNAVDQRWEGVLDNLKVGDTVKVVVTTTNGSSDEGTATVVAMGS
ncbi:hypothetical protein [Desulfofundulus thermocisternus]|uniref:hypothetical protein n=1 Tax=Desulfofundulus thermocisternus TaxID=42471 RepID=UPI00217E8FD2|nr:hypothetical protein [Desulfofundulus thermocisternus]MCS5696545.1 hypothetical protein [Desulfofundulus thermocisternus]